MTASTMMSSVSATFATLLLWLVCLEATQAQTGPLVTLSHGGQPRGRSFTYNGTNVDLFMGKFVTADISVISKGVTVPYIFLILETFCPIIFAFLVKTFVEC